MIALGCDGNNKLFPLAFFIIEEENIDSWGWLPMCCKKLYESHTNELKYLVLSHLR